MYCETHYTGGMRGLALLPLLFTACGFHVGAGGSMGADDTVADAPALDAPPDTATVLPACMTNAAYTGTNGTHRYRKTANLDHDDGLDACRADGAHLATLETQAESQFVGSFGGGLTWIGLNDLDVEGTFRWETGPPVSYVGFTGIEPNDNGVEDCVYTNSNGSWNDSNCGASIPAICECEVGFMPPPTPACRTMGGATKLDGRAYFIRTATKTWADAEADCAAIGAHLAVLADDEESIAVDNRFVGDSWIGMSDLAAEGNYVWVNGSASTYRKWDLLEPTDTITQNCVRLSISWYDTDCAQMKQYACECDPTPP